MPPYLPNGLTIYQAYLLGRGFTNPTIGQKALAHAVAEIGNQESPYNDNVDPPGKNRIRTYQSSTGKYGQAWCASFVTWCFKQVGRNVGANFNSAYCPDWVSVSQSNNCRGSFGIHAIFGTTQRNYELSIDTIRRRVRPGDIALFDWKNPQDGISDHIGIVEYPPNRSGYFICIEGNAGSPGAVRRVRRNVDEVIDWARVR